MGDEIVKGNKCWSRAAFIGEVADCPCLTKHGNEELCTAGPYAGDCDAEPIYVYPKARHAATQAAIGTAIITLQFALEDARKAADTAALHTITETIARLRALGSAE